MELKAKLFLQSQENKFRKDQFPKTIVLAAHFQHHNYISYSHTEILHWPLNQNFMKTQLWNTNYSCSLNKTNSKLFTQRSDIFI